MSIDRGPREPAALHRRFQTASIAYAGFGLCGAFLVAANPGVLADGLGSFLDFLVSPWMIATYAIAGGFLAYGGWFLKRSTVVPGEEVDVERLMRRQASHLALAFGALAIGLVAVGGWCARDLRAASRDARLSEQRSVARLKAQEVDKWLYERVVDTEVIGATVGQLLLDRSAADPGVRRFVEVLFAELMARNPEHRAVVLLAPDGSVLVHAGDAAAIGPAAIAIVRRAVAARSGTQVVDTADIAGGAPPQFDFVLPLATPSAAGSVLVLSADPGKQLLPQVGHWPSDSASSEILLVRRDGDKAVYMLAPRSTVGKPVLQSQPLAAAGSAIVDALERGEGVREGRDGRGVDVISASAGVRGVGWQVVALTDVDEVVRPLSRRLAALFGVIVTAIGAAGLITLMLWQGQRATYLALHEHQRQERLALSRHFEQSIRAARDIVLLYDPEGRIVDCNAAAIAAYGYTADELTRLGARDIVVPEDWADLERQWPEGDVAGGHLIESRHRRRDGTTFPVEISSLNIDIEGHSYRQAFVRDVSGRRALQGQVERLKHVLSGLHAATGILLRARSEAELYQGMCRIAVDVAGYRLASVALAHDDADKTVSWVAVAGDDDGYLAQTAITWADGPRGQGPTGTAIRTGEVTVNQSFADNPRVAPWREEALKRGLRSSIALPLFVGDKCFGALTIYGAQPDIFDAEETAILTRFADDISYGVGALRLGDAAKAAPRATP